MLPPAASAAVNLCSSISTAFVLFFSYRGSYCIFYGVKRDKRSMLDQGCCICCKVIQCRSIIVLMVSIEGVYVRRCIENKMTICCRVASDLAAQPKRWLLNFQWGAFHRIDFMLFYTIIMWNMVTSRKCDHWSSFMKAVQPPQLPYIILL